MSWFKRKKKETVEPPKIVNMEYLRFQRFKDEVQKVKDEGLFIAESDIDDPKTLHELYCNNGYKDGYYLIRTYRIMYSNNSQINYFLNTKESLNITIREHATFDNIDNTPLTLCLVSIKTTENYKSFEEKFGLCEWKKGDIYQESNYNYINLRKVLLKYEFIAIDKEKLEAWFRRIDDNETIIKSYFTICHRGNNISLRERKNEEENKRKQLEIDKLADNFNEEGYVKC